MPLCVREKALACQPELVEASAAFAVVWLILYWTYRKKEFIRIRWRESEYRLREIYTAMLPAEGLANTLGHWQEIARLLADSKRN